jgi:hypothetical protein
MTGLLPTVSGKPWHVSRFVGAGFKPARPRMDYQPPRHTPGNAAASAWKNFM